MNRNLYLTLLILGSFVCCSLSTQVQVHPANTKRCMNIRERENLRLEAVGCALYAPIPVSSYGPGINPDVGFRADDIGHGVKVLTEGSYMSLIIETSTGFAILVDPPEGNWGSDSDMLVNAIKASTSQPIKTIVYSHYHLDHIGNAGKVASAFQTVPIDVGREYESSSQPVNIVCHSETQKLLKFHVKSGDLRRPLCTTTWSGFKDYNLTVGNQTLELSYKSRGHKPGNIFIYHPQTKLLMLVDVIFPGWAPFRNLALADDTAEYYQNHKQVLKYDFDYFVGGHLTIIGNRTDVETSKEFIEDVIVGGYYGLTGPDAPNFYQLIGDLGIFDQTSHNFLNQWLLFHSYFERAVDVCENYVLDKWVPARYVGSCGESQHEFGDIRLAAVDVFLREHCFSALESIRIEGTPSFLKYVDKKADKKIENVNLQQTRIFRDISTRKYL